MINVINIWPGAAPGTEHWTQKESTVSIPGINQSVVRNVTQPSLTAFLPDPGKATGTGVIIAPGGGFKVIAWDSEGVLSARLLAEHGVAAFVLKYRVDPTPGTDAEFLSNPQTLPPGLPAGKSAPDLDTGPNKGGPGFTGLGAASRAYHCADVRQAVKVLRERGAQFGVRSDRIGVLAFSAGTFGATELAMDHDASNRPNFMTLVYGGGNVQGRTVPKDAPPLFLVHAHNDPLLNPLKAMSLYSAWAAAEIPVDLHIYSKGGHGFGMVKQNLPVDHWGEAYVAWLADLGLLKAPAR